MSKIKFFALGGLGENGKNMYVCEVDERIFILDAGLKYPSVELYIARQKLIAKRIIKRVRHYCRHLTTGSIIILVVKSRAIRKIGIIKSKRTRFFIHKLNEISFASRNVLRKHKHCKQDG